MLSWHFNSKNSNTYFYLPWRNISSGPRPSYYRGFIITHRSTILGRIPLDEWSARRRDLHLTTHNTYNRDIHAPGRIQTHNPSKREALDPRLRPRGHWDRTNTYYFHLKFQRSYISIDNYCRKNCRDFWVWEGNIRCHISSELIVLAALLMNERRTVSKNKLFI
jgi:hypothetical protein